ncbi:MAG: alpha-L-fucosidase [Massilibacteroides sp.]|nr:alpha-L-fucosidase [Massilibacteroides sp.]
MVIDAKHHGGFCLWPSKYNDHYTIKNTPWKNGKGDMVRELVDACRAGGLEVGMYLSPWDRNHKDYGKPEYNEYYKNQLRELLTEYGPIFMVWLDGANGGDGYYGGANEMRRVNQRTYYPVQEWIDIVRELQPDALMFSDMGPDVRWCGNEEGITTDTCWASVSGLYWSPQYTPEFYKMLNSGDRNGQDWIPAEVNFPLRLHPKGWFWHPGPSNTPASVKELVDIYFGSVGRNCSMDIGIAPDRKGLICDEDIASLTGFGKYIRDMYALNLAKLATFSASNFRGNNPNYAAKEALDGKIREKYWATDDEIKDAELFLDFDKTIEFNVVSISENLRLGQRIDSWAIDIWKDNQWEEVGKGVGIGSKRLWRGDKILRTNKIRFRITQASASPVVEEFGVYLAPKILNIPMITRNKRGDVKIQVNDENMIIYYTLDGSLPDKQANKYNGLFAINGKVEVKAVAYDVSSDRYSDISSVLFDVSKKEWKALTKLDNTENLFDGDAMTYSISKEVEQEKDLIIDLGRIYPITGFKYLPPQKVSAEGIIFKYDFFISKNGKDWFSVSNGEFSNIKNSPFWQTLKFDKMDGRYVKLRAIKDTEDNYTAGYAEFDIITN